MVAAALWLPPSWDWAVWDWMSAQQAPVFAGAEIAIVDVPWETNKAVDRRRIASFLNELVAQKAQRPPKAVILDVAFGPCDTYPAPCGEPMESARQALIAAIRNANAHFDVYAREQPVLLHDDSATGVNPYDEDIYGKLTGFGHTQFTTLANPDGLIYRACYAWAVKDKDGNVDRFEHMWDIVERVKAGTAFDPTTCDPTAFAVRVAHDPLPDVQKATTTLTQQGTFPASTPFDSKYVIVGTIANDPGLYPPLRGPQILAWAFSNALQRGSGENAHATWDTDPQDVRRDHARGVYRDLLSAQRNAAAVAAACPSVVRCRCIGLRWARRICSIRGGTAKLGTHPAAGNAHRGGHRVDGFPG